MRALGLATLLGLCASAVAAPSKPAPEKARWEQLPEAPAMPAPTSHGEVSVGGARIYYAQYGKPDGPPVVLLHGGLGNSEHWGAQLPALADTYRIIAIDSRGQGRSTRGKATLTYDLMASDAIAVLDQLAIQKASFIGWSDGGEVALLLGIHYADRTDKLVAIGVNYDSNGAKPRGSRTATFQAYTARCRAEFIKLTRPAQPDRAWDLLVDGVLPVWRSPMSITKAQLPTIAAPTLILDGEHDEVIVVEQERELAQILPHARFVGLPDASHFAMWQAPAEVNAAIVEFLAAR